MPSAWQAYHDFMRARLPNGGRCVSCQAPFEVHMSEVECMNELKLAGFAAEQIGANPQEVYYQHVLELMQKVDVQEGDPMSVSVGARMALAFRYVCGACKNIPEQEMYAKAKRNAAKERLARMLTNKLIFAAMLKNTFEASLPLREASNASQWAMARLWSHDKDGNLWVFGESDAGKTWLCECILNAAIATGAVVAEVSGLQLKGYAGYDMAENCQPLIDADVLLIDDICQANWTTGTVEPLMLVLDGRNKRELRTLFTANSEPEVFFTQMESARPDTDTLALPMTRRLNLPGHACQLVPMLTGRSLRRQTQAGKGE